LASGTGEALFLAHLDVIERVIAFVCGRHHLPSAEADDFGSHVKLKLVEDDYAILKKFEGRSSLRTYLTIVIQRLFLDYRISAWGKWRPSAEAKRIGTVAVLLEQLMVRDGHSFSEACELLKTNYGLSIGQGDLERVAGRLPVRAKRRFESDDVLRTVPSEDRRPDDLAGEADRQRAADRLSGALQRLTANFDTQDRLILALKFEDGRAVSEIATMLRLDQKGLYRRLERLLHDLRKGLEAEGIDGTSVLEILESPAVIIAWEPKSEELRMRRPSIDTGARP
jgi:RNA polymerase sigma factor for flagellar operon FliA